MNGPLEPWDVLANLMESAAYSRMVYGVYGPMDAPMLGPKREPDYGCDCECDYCAYPGDD